LLTYPSTTAYSSGLTVKREYNSLGYLTQVKNNSNNSLFWQADVMTARGQLSQATLGNGTTEYTGFSAANDWLTSNTSTNSLSLLRDMSYSFDDVGRITERVDLLQNHLAEAFTYDQLDRLTSSSISGGVFANSSFNRNFQYDAVGNITYKSGVGSYNYTTCGTRVHAVCSAGGTNYSYDANGSMVSSTVGSNVTSVGYTAFNKANAMQKGNTAVNFNYDADRMRNYKTSVVDNNNTSTYYVSINGVGYVPIN